MGDRRMPFVIRIKNVYTAKLHANMSPYFLIKGCKITCQTINFTGAIMYLFLVTHFHHHSNRKKCWKCILGTKKIKQHVCHFTRRVISVMADTFLSDALISCKKSKINFVIIRNSTSWTKTSLLRWYCINLAFYRSFRVKVDAFFRHWNMKQFRRSRATRIRITRWCERVVIA